MAFREELDALSDDYVRDFVRRDASACASAYTEDAEVYHSMGECDRGRKAIEAAFSKAIADGLLVTKLTTVWASASGDLGCAIQTFDSTAGPGMVMLALKRNAEGAWKVCREVFVPS